MAECQELETVVYCLGPVGGHHNIVCTSGSAFEKSEDYTTKGYDRYIQEAKNVLELMTLILSYFMESVKEVFDEDPLGFIDQEPDENFRASIHIMKKKWRDMFKEHQKNLRNIYQDPSLKESVLMEEDSSSGSSENVLKEGISSGSSANVLKEGISSGSSANVLKEGISSGSSENVLKEGISSVSSENVLKEGSSSVSSQFVAKEGISSGSSEVFLKKGSSCGSSEVVLKKGSSCGSSEVVLKKGSSCWSSEDVLMEGSSSVSSQFVSKEGISTGSSEVFMPDGSSCGSSEVVLKRSQSGEKSSMMDPESSAEKTGSKVSKLPSETVHEPPAKVPRLDLHSVATTVAKDTEPLPEAGAKALGTPVDEFDHPESIFEKKAKKPFSQVLREEYQQFRKRMQKFFDKIMYDERKVRELTGFTLNKMAKFAKWKYDLKMFSYLITDLEVKFKELDLNFAKEKPNEKRLNNWLYFDDGKRDRKYHHRLLIPLDLSVSVDQVSALGWKQIKRWRKIETLLYNTLPEEREKYDHQLEEWKYRVLYKRAPKRPLQIVTSNDSDDTFALVSPMPADTPPEQTPQ